MDFASLETLRIPKAIAKPPGSLKCLRNPQQLDVSENVEQTQTTRKRRTQKEMLETLKTQHNYKQKKLVKNKETV